MADVLAQLGEHIRVLQPGVVAPWLLAKEPLAAAASQDGSIAASRLASSPTAAIGSDSGTGSASGPGSARRPTLCHDSASSPLPSAARCSVDLSGGLQRPSMRFYSVDQTNCAFQQFTSKHWIGPAQLQSMTRNAKQVAQGAFAGIVKARVPTSNGCTRTVAIKQLKHEIVQEEQNLKDFMWECSLLCELRHA